MSAEVAKNYTEKMVETMVANYTSNPSRETVEVLAKEFGKSVRSIIAKLSREGVYIAQPRTTKTGAPITRKADVVAEIGTSLEGEFPSLVKASKSDLIALNEALVNFLGK
jgi:bifunctional N-acetylglucosamine-1-phosphate-uridyltransferase/glucosamine-1-phosphate-acetyltransferase GlmU-like protein